MDQRPSKIPVLILPAVMAGAILLRVFDPATSAIFPPCPVRALTGWYCSGCGSLRAFHQLLLGNFSDAFALNPLAVLSLPFLAYGFASYLLFQVRGRYLPKLLLPAFWIRALAVVIVLFGVARNLPVHPFDWLAPGAMLRP